MLVDPTQHQAWTNSQRTKICQPILFRSPASTLMKISVRNNMNGHLFDNYWDSDPFLATSNSAALVFANYGEDQGGLECFEPPAATLAPVREGAPEISLVLARVREAKAEGRLNL
ncbi:hypothetical protein B0H19DRAFT_1080144 [Mycena capillaripes]|nr:hypothetical protein B0H19DRAFT_1080144 [Mycena capillaripes]